MDAPAVAVIGPSSKVWKPKRRYMQQPLLSKAARKSSQKLRLKRAGRFKKVVRKLVDLQALATVPEHVEPRIHEAETDSVRQLFLVQDPETWSSNWQSHHTSNQSSQQTLRQLLDLPTAMLDLIIDQLDGRALSMLACTNQELRALTVSSR